MGAPRMDLAPPTALEGRFAAAAQAAVDSAKPVDLRDVIEISAESYWDLNDALQAFRASTVSSSDRKAAGDVAV